MSDAEHWSTGGGDPRGAPMTGRDPHFTGRRLTAVQTAWGLPLGGDDFPSADLLMDELLAMLKVLSGFEDSPLDGQTGYLAMMEVATAFKVRARQIEMRIFRMERTVVAFPDGSSGDPRSGPFLVAKGTPLYAFRTGFLRSFVDACDDCIDLGSRRLTEEDLLYRQKGDISDVQRVRRGA